MTVKLLLIYFAIINFIGIVINITDKQKAKRNKWRIRESTIWAVALLGGAPFTYLTMKFIHHKTKHKSFMLGMPILSLIQIAALTYMLIKLTGGI